ncbi:hypothetical protein Q8W40_09595 [Vibrio penaeicida]|uniref:hypothetical protein n=1 Tax=Vibrio penaeicida TaxID=104609 RepID=UPI002733D65E|nr:hypothetical protein [Vibrio penaeicida]MDP2572433.1 hypothetical protein [Vibrio penaeicida]
MELIKRLMMFGIYVPFQMAFSYLMAPILATILLFGGMGFLFVILGYEDGVKVFLNSMKQRQVRQKEKLIS